jgi:hypothetical protein
VLVILRKAIEEVVAELRDYAPDLFDDNTNGGDSR